MDFSVFVFAVICLAVGVNSMNHNTITRRKREIEDKWSWGYVEVTKRPPNVTSEKPAGTQRLTEEVNPCKLPPLKMPNFKAPGKRISEQKCEEYLWGIKKRIEDTKRSNACVEYSKKHGILVGSTAAVGGRDALPGEYPHMGAIGWKAVVGTWLFKCGGFLISPKFVLTAAHCTKASDSDTEIADPVPKIIRFGDKSIKDELTTSIPIITANIAKIIPHPQYKSPTKYYDIALMELAFEIWFNKNVQPACLWTNFDTSPLGRRATVTGWGVLKAGSRNTSAILQVAQVDIIDSKTCDDLLKPKRNRHWSGIQDTQVCAGKLSGGVDACQGDSGGPLQIKIPLPSNVEGAMHYVIGVTSFGFGCALENTPGVYTRVQPFLDWIEGLVWAQES